MESSLGQRLFELSCNNIFTLYGSLRDKLRKRIFRGRLLCSVFFVFSISELKPPKVEQSLLQMKLRAAKKHISWAENIRIRFEVHPCKHIHTERKNSKKKLHSLVLLKRLPIPSIMYKSLEYKISKVCMFCNCNWE